MAEEVRSIHYVCTWEQAQQLLDKAPDFWVGTCGCREGKGVCARTPHDVCLAFDSAFQNPEAVVKHLSKAEVDDLMRLAGEKFLVTRPFRDFQTRTRTEGICFCCDDCCGYFLHHEEVCDKGTLIEETDMSHCTHCSLCEPKCYFGARTMQEGELVVDRQKCYGCGLCVEVCPEKCIAMATR